eukprot:SAG31_NODE_226_length_19837_cov_4.368730_3_plen_152_part_00
MPRDISAISVPHHHSRRSYCCVRKRRARDFSRAPRTKFSTRTSGIRYELVQELNLVGSSATRSRHQAARRPSRAAARARRRPLSYASGHWWCVPPLNWEGRPEPPPKHGTPNNGRSRRRGALTCVRRPGRASSAAGGGGWRRRRCSSAAAR